MSTIVAASSNTRTTSTLRRGLRLTPEFLHGLPLTLGLAVVGTAGQVLVPVAVQQAVDKGLHGPQGADVGFVQRVAVAVALALVVTAFCQYWVNRRLFTATEHGLASLRVKAFAHIHQLSVLTQDAQRRGSLVSRVTSDVDTVSLFMQRGGLVVLTSTGQLLVATVLMAFWSWQLTLVVWGCFLPLFYALRWFAIAVRNAYADVRVRVADMLAAVAESVVGATVIRAYAVEERTGARIDRALIEQRDSQVRAQRRSVMAFSCGEIASGVCTTALVVVGVGLGVGGHLSVGRLLGFLFFVPLFVGPVQSGTEVINEAQNAIAGWSRVLAVLDTVPDVADVGADGSTGSLLTAGPLEVSFQEVRFSYPEGPEVLHRIDVAIPAGRRVAVVGETGSGKTTFAKLLVRLMDPTVGCVRLGGVDLREVANASLRARVVLVPQDGFLFDASIADNARYGRPDATDADVEAALVELGLENWLTSLPHGVATRVGQRGERLSAGERQLVSLVRAGLARPDVLVLDEATSAVDPATEVRIGRALEALSRGRTVVTVAHRLSTAEAADEVLVFDHGHVVERGVHRDLVGAGGVYARLHESWASTTRSQ